MIAEYEVDSRRIAELREAVEGRDKRIARLEELMAQLAAEVDRLNAELKAKGN